MSESEKIRGLVLTRLFKTKDFASIVFIGGAIVYFFSIIWINFHSKQWYSFDVYSDSLLARIMVEEGSLLPQNWVFGNQEYFIATPVLAALFYLVCKNSVLALSMASSLMTVFILSSFVWAIKPFVNSRQCFVGVFCLSGAVILGNSAATYVNGMEYFYTMASFYSCYVIAIFFTLGVYFRMRSGIFVFPPLYVLSFLISVALGMQSLRGTLVLYFILVLYSVIVQLIKKSEIKSMLFSCAMFACNICGILLMKVIPYKSAPIISDIALRTDYHELIEELHNTFTELLKITGLSFCANGLKWLPLFCVSVFFVVVVLGVLIDAFIGLIKYKTVSVIGECVFFLWISVLAVFVVGVFLFKVRAIYFFS